MSARPATHRARGQARREALLVAAIEVVAERGAGAATHRAIAERAGVPPSTTTYFFSSIRELVFEAMRHFTAAQVEQLSALNAALTDQRAGDAEIAGLFADAIARVPTQHTVAQFEAYLTASRTDDPEDRTAITGVLDAFEDVARTALESFGVARASEVAPLLVAIADGISLRHVASGEPIDRDLLADAFHRMILTYAEHPYGAALPDRPGSQPSR